MDGAPHNRCVPGGKNVLSKLNKLLENNYTEVDNDYGPTIGSQAVRIIEDECIGCTKCIDACPVNAISGAPNLMHTVIEDICTGCELCIEPCPVDCIETINIEKEKSDNIRNNSKEFFNYTKKNRTQKRKKLKNNTDLNLEVTSIINERIKNRNIDKSSNLKELQIKTLTQDLKQNHDFTDEQVNDFINNNEK